MKDRTFEELGHRFVMPQGAAQPATPTERHRAEGRLAVEIAHAADLETIATFLKSGQSVLVECDKALCDYIYLALSDPDRGLLSGKDWSSVTHGTNPPAVGTLIRHLIGQTAALLGNAQHNSKAIVLIRHLDLMAWTVDNRPSPDLGELVYWFAERRGAVILAFWDPIFPLPKIIESYFPNRLAFGTFDREVFWELVQRDEALRVSPSRGFTISAQCTLYQYLAGTNVVEVRRILRSIVDSMYGPHPHEADLDRLFNHIRKQTGLAPLVREGEVIGYADLERELNREVLLPFELRSKAATPAELLKADALMPRGVLLYGPPGTGKTEWARWLAHRLKTPLLTISGPELKNKFVGETEAAIRRIFAQARRSAPSIILIDEIDAMLPSRDRAAASNFDVSIVGQLLAEMDGMRQEEAVVVVGTTNRMKDIDPAFLRPGRFGTRIKVDYPTEADREAILQYYGGEKMDLGLTPESMKHIVEKTSRLSGDHLRAICRFLLLESLEPGHTPDHLNKHKILNAAIEAVQANESTDRKVESGRFGG